MNKLLALATLAAIATAPAHALVLTQWNFNSMPSDNSASTGTLTPNIGLGIASLVGGTTGSFASGDANGGSTDPVTGSPTNDSAWGTTTYAAQGSGDKSRGVQFKVDTTGHQAIVVRWDQRLSNTAARHSQFQYTLDGSTFIDAVGGLFTGSAGGDTWYNNRSVDLSAVTGAANNANFGFRIVATFAPGTSSYLAATTGSNYATTGTQRFDMVTVSAMPVPEPQTYALMLAGLVAVGMLARRRA